MANKITIGTLVFFSFITTSLNKLAYFNLNKSSFEISSYKSLFSKTPIFSSFNILYISSMLANLFLNLKLPVSAENDIFGFFYSLISSSFLYWMFWNKDSSLWSSLLSCYIISFMFASTWIWLSLCYFALRKNITLSSRY